MITDPESLPVRSRCMRSLHDLYLRSLNAGQGGAEAISAELAGIRRSVEETRDAGLRNNYRVFARLIALRVPLDDRLREAPAAAGARDAPAAPGFPDRILPGGKPGVSLVSCSMNRTENLLRVLPSWLDCPEICEIVVVDWSSRDAVDGRLAAAGFDDPRIRIVRVEGEPRWILSYAFNTGFRAASCATILKADADIVLSRDFFAKNPMHSGNDFVAGNWRVADAEQAHVNGFFLASRAALAAVGGFSEFITTYGWDDDDLYARLERAGFRRNDVAARTIYHLPHDDAQRVEPAAAGSVLTLRQSVLASPRFLIQRNRLITERMPAWTADGALLPLDAVGRDGRVITLRRAPREHPEVPAAVFEAATGEAERELMAWDFGPGVRQLAAEAFDRVMQRPAAMVARLDFELAAVSPGRLAADGAPYLLIAPEPALLAPAGTDQARRRVDALARLIGAAQGHGCHCVLTAPFPTMPPSAPERLRGLPFLPSWLNTGALPEASAEQILAGPPPATARLSVDPALLDGLYPAAPSVIPGRARFYIDAQHGLGNRLRAIGSAAAIAAATGRELVIVWQPDDHCDCRFADLFDYPGAVTDVSFLADAGDCDVHNYMPIEGGEKDAPIRTEGSRDVYARSAFVLRHPASTWARENAFLQALTPVAAVRDLVASVRSPNDVSAHVRMEGGRKDEHLAYESTANWTPEDHALIDFWRGKSHYSAFARRLDTLIAEGRAERIFLAADQPEAYERFATRYGGRLAWLPRTRYDRSAEQLRYALADVILLSRAPMMLASNWSSFSELAMRLATVKQVVEMSGKDF